MSVYFFGGGFVAGDGSEPRYDGGHLAQEGIVTLTVSYRLGVFGFMAHPELTKRISLPATGLFWINIRRSNGCGDISRRLAGPR